MENLRDFEAGPDPFGRKWKVSLRWLQNGISIRHADTVDVKWEMTADDGTVMERVVALPHPDLLRLRDKLSRPLTDSWCIRLARRRIEEMLCNWEDAEKGILTMQPGEMEEYGRALHSELASASR